MNRLLVVIFPLFFALTIILGYCLKGALGPNSYMYSAVIVVLIATSFAGRKDPDGKA